MNHKFLFQIISIYALEMCFFGLNKSFLIAWCVTLISWIIWELAHPGIEEDGE
jgi:hypothetical protein